MINAFEARDRAKNLIEEKSKAQMKKIESRIHKFVLDGLFEMTLFDEVILPTVASQLKELGYRIHPQESHRNETSIKISW